MKVVFLDSIRGVAQVGDVKDVADGYARNYLLPRRLARAATPGALKDIESVKARKLAAQAASVAEAQAMAAKLSGVTVTVTGKANEQGTLFAAIEADEVARAIADQTGQPVNAAAVKMSEHLKTVGDHPITLDLAEGVTAEMTITVTAQ